MQLFQLWSFHEKTSQKCFQGTIGAFTEAENFFPFNWITNNKFSSFRAALEEKCCVGVNCARAGGPVIEKNFDS